jgi:hypothetical protein
MWRSSISDFPDTELLEVISADANRVALLCQPDEALKDRLDGHVMLSMPSL